jgi:hypothetical protein
MKSPRELRPRRRALGTASLTSGSSAWRERRAEPSRADTVRALALIPQIAGTRSVWLTLDEARRTLTQGLTQSPSG